MAEVSKRLYRYPVPDVCSACCATAVIALYNLADVDEAGSGYVHKRKAISIVKKMDCSAQDDARVCPACCACCMLHALPLVVCGPT